MQYPTEVPGVAVVDVLEAAYAGLGRDPAGVADRIRAEAGRIGFDDRFLHRAMNVDLSGGEKKRNETLQLGVLEPAIAILDELDSGLDLDALRACARRIEAATEETGLGVLAITHYSRLLHELRADHVHVLSDGVIQRSGGPELAEELERTGYAVEEPAAATPAIRRIPSPIRWPEPALLAGGAVDGLSEEVGVPVVPRRLLDHVAEDPAQGEDLTGLAAGRRRRAGRARSPPATTARLRSQASS